MCVFSSSYFKTEHHSNELFKMTFCNMNILESQNRMPSESIIVNAIDKVIESVPVMSFLGSISILMLFSQ